MSEVVESLNSLLEKLSMAKGGTVDGNEEEEKSFRSTYTRFIGSPELTYSSPGLDHWYQFKDWIYVTKNLTLLGLKMSQKEERTARPMMITRETMSFKKGSFHLQKNKMLNVIAIGALQSTWLFSMFL
jgi:hypothetical protein